MGARDITMSKSNLDVFSDNHPGGLIRLTGKHSVSLTNGTALDASSLHGRGGTIQIDGGKRFTSEQSRMFAAVGDGSNGGTIRIRASNLNLKDSQLDTSVGLGPVEDSAGGRITLEGKQVVLTNSQLTASVSPFDGPTAVAGTISVGAKTVILRNSQLLSTAEEGQGGTIAIRSHALVRDATSLIDASSQSGTDGTVIIERR